MISSDILITDLNNLSMKTHDNMICHLQVFRVTYANYLSIQRIEDTLLDSYLGYYLHGLKIPLFYTI